MLIRAATLDDVAQIAVIHDHYALHSHITFDIDPFSPEEAIVWFRAHSDGHRYRSVVAEDDSGRVLGYAGTGRFRPKAAYETTVEVTVACSPDAQGQGIGTRLYTALFAVLAGEDIHLIVAGIAQPNPASNALHQRFGFRPVGTFAEVGRKFDRYWDVTWMERRAG